MSAGAVETAASPLDASNARLMRAARRLAEAHDELDEAERELSAAAEAVEELEAKR